MTAWERDEANELQGYIQGNPIQYRIWDVSAQTEYTAEGEIENNRGNGTYGFGPYTQVHIAVTGNLEADINVFPSPLGFGNVVVNNDLTLNLNIRNDGFADLTVNSVSYQGNQVFAIGAFEPVVLAPAEVTTVDVTFSPTAVQQYTGTITVQSDDPDEGTVTVNVSGSGIEEGDTHFIAVEETGQPYAVVVDRHTLMMNRCKLVMKSVSSMVSFVLGCQ